MNIERERKYIINQNQANQLTRDTNPWAIDQLYLSERASDSELRMRRVVREKTEPTYLATLKLNHGERRPELEVPIFANSFATLSTQALAKVYKNRHLLDRPGLTVDRYPDGLNVLELEQKIGTPDIGLFDPNELGVGDVTEVTGISALSNRALATEFAKRKEKIPDSADFATIYDKLDDFQRSPTPSIVTIGGPSAGGKTTLAQKLRERYGENITTISTDDYYIGIKRMANEMPAGQEKNFYNPAAIDVDRLARDIDRLKRGASIERPNYDFKTGEPTGHNTTVDSANLIAVEGLVANDSRIRAMTDLALLLNAPVAERLWRRVARDSGDGGRTNRSEEVTMQMFMNNAEPSYRKYYATDDSEADYVIKTDESM